MKINWKTIVIVLIVVAVAVYLFWDKLFKKEGPGNGGSTDSGNASSLDYILSKISFNSKERNAIKSLWSKAQSDSNVYDLINDKTFDSGLTFAQQLVCDAIWNLYTSNGSWTDDRGWKLTEKVKNL